ncbi:MAG: DNA gyrase C-terminal beta-propeller domain-containing protein, partial [Nocardioides sp.]
KRVLPDLPAHKDSWEFIRLADGDDVVGALDLTTGHESLCFITSDAQLLRFAAELVRPQGRGGGGMAGVRLAAGAHVAWFGTIDLDDRLDEAVVVTSSGAASALPGTEPGSQKVTPFADFPAKGRGTAGVRCHRFLKGEDTLIFAWAGHGPPRGAAPNGAPIELTEARGKRDGSGLPGTVALAGCAGPIAQRVATLPAGSVR